MPAILLGGASYLSWSGDSSERASASTSRGAVAGISSISGRQATAAMLRDRSAAPGKPAVSGGDPRGCPSGPTSASRRLLAGACEHPFHCLQHHFGIALGAQQERRRVCRDRAAGEPAHGARHRVACVPSELHGGACDIPGDGLRPYRVRRGDKEPAGLRSRALGQAGEGDLRCRLVRYAPGGRERDEDGLRRLADRPRHLRIPGELDQFRGRGLGDDLRSQ